jgi:hypothetical protein
MSRPYKVAAEQHGAMIADRLFDGRVKKQTGTPGVIVLTRDELRRFAAAAYELGANMTARVALGDDEDDHES